MKKIIGYCIECGKPIYDTDTHYEGYHLELVCEECGERELVYFKEFEAYIWEEDDPEDWEITTYWYDEKAADICTFELVEGVKK